MLENQTTLDSQVYAKKLDLRLSLLTYMEIATGKEGEQVCDWCIDNLLIRVDDAGSIQPLVLAGRQLGYDRQALRGGG